jgi:nucleoside-diphosphate-sugar epimerase
MDTDNQNNKYTLIITGCNGFTGYELCRSLAGHFRVIGVARAGRDVSGLEKIGVKCITYEELQDFTGSVLALVHCAGKIGNTGKWEDFRKINVQWTKELYQLSGKIQAKYFVYISSIAALGYKNRYHQKPLKEDEQPILCRGELYGLSKLRAEEQLEDARISSNVRLVVLRPGFIYNRERLSRRQSWLKRGCIVDFDERIPLVHIQSLIDAVRNVIRAPDLSGIFHVVDDTQPTRRELTAFQLKHGLLIYRPWQIGFVGFSFLEVVRWVISKTGLKKMNLPVGFLRASSRFNLRKNIYSNIALQKACDWRSMKELSAVLMSSTQKK